MLRFIFLPRYASRAIALALLAGICWALFSPRASQARREGKLQTQTTKPLPSLTGSANNDEDIYVLYRNERGETACRPATKAERDQINARERGGPTRVIYPGASRDGENAIKSEDAPGLNLLPSAGLRIVLHGTTQLDGTPVAKNAFIVAANRWEAIIATPITVVIDVDFGTTFFGTPYPSPSILGATTSSSFTGPFSDFRQRLINGASNSNETQLYNLLPPTELPTEVNDVTGSVTNARATNANARALGLVPDIANPDALGLGQADAGIGFNSAFNFDFDPTNGIVADQADFDAVATHEIGHALGFTSNAGRPDTTSVSVWDIYRFRPARASLDTFGTAPRVLSIGGDQRFWGNQLSTYAIFELDLSTGGPNPLPGDGDGRQSSHWRDDALISTRQYIGIMDPTLQRGLRRTISENDMLALDLFGYTIGGPPIVRPPNDNFANAIALNGDTGTLTATNVNATREVGEPNSLGLMTDKSVWYSWIPTVNGQATIDTIGSDFDTTLIVYQGTTITLLGTVALNDEAVNKASRVQFPVNAGQTYRVVVDGWNSEFGNITLNWTATGEQPTPTPTPSPTPTPTPTPSPTPTPPADMGIESFVASPDQLTTDQIVTFTLTARNTGPGPAHFPQFSITLPAGTSFNFCVPGCTPPLGSNGGTATFAGDTLAVNTPFNFSVTARVTSATGVTLHATANVSSGVPDPNLSNNGRAAAVRVVELIPFRDAQKISMSSEGHYVLALRRGTVWGWGHNFHGQLGNGNNTNQPIPVQTDDLMSVTDISAGHDFAVALKSDGTVWTWGRNEFGRLGIGSATPSNVNRPVKVVGLSSIIAIAAGNSHTLALRADGTVWTWGGNGSGELGLGTSDFGSHVTPVQVPGLAGIVSIYNRGRVCYAVKADGTVFGWGTTFSGTLGDGTSGTPSVMSPIELPALKGMIAASTGVLSTVAIKADGAVLSFGNNFRGQLGRGLFDNGPFPVPTQVPALLAKHVSNGTSFVIVTEQAGTLKVFGRNEQGQLATGIADPFPHPTPIPVTGITGAIAAVAGNNAGLALISDPLGNTIRSWGGNLSGELGNGLSPSSSFNPTSVLENQVVALPIFSVAAGTIPATQVQVACGTPGSVIHYTTNGSDPTESDPIVAHGGTVAVTSSITLKARAFRTGFAASPVKSVTYNVVGPVPLQLLTDTSGPAVDQVAAFDVLTLLRDPFPVISIDNVLNLGTDKNTRVGVFVSNLQQVPNEPPSVVVVNLVGSNNQNYDVPAEDVRAVANSEFIQVSFRLPDSLAPGTCTIRIKSHAQVSNAGTIRVKP